MKKLILYDHQGTKLLEQEVFVEGQDFRWQSPKPVAFWLGEICLVDKEVAEIAEYLELANVPIEPELILVKEEKVELEKVDNQSTGDSRASEASEPESAEGLLEQPAGGEPSKRSKKPRKRKAT